MKINPLVYTITAISLYSMRT